MDAEDGRRYQGEIVEWYDEKQSGFISPRGSGVHDPVVFLTRSAFVTRDRAPQVGDTVLYEVDQVGQSKKAKLRTTLRARRVVYLGDQLPGALRSKGEVVVCCLGVVHIGAVALSMVLTDTQPWPVLWTLVMSVFGFVAVCWDKLMALRKTWRVSENNLLLLALLGGWPGSALAQTAIRHKTQKEPFRTVFRWTSAANVILTAVVFLGIALLRR